jgi:nanoRNase/pAp phosphatase (c-di-AMP/oligoRNAs hydrolase)
MSQPTSPGTPAAAGPSSESAARAAELGRLLEGRRGERHLVAIQDFPDPDAISCAMAYREIAHAFGVVSDIVYEGEISHPENLALVNLLEVELHSFGDGLELEGYNAAVFVDNQGSTTHLTARLEEARVPTLAVVDHHETQDLLDPIFTDIRPVAAAATLFSEYLESGLLLRLDAANESHVRLATALMHGLHSETNGFVRARPPEYRAAAYLSRYMDPDLLERVLCVKKSHGTLRVIEEALHTRVVRNGFSVAGIGYLRWNDRDAIPQAAEFILNEENVHTTVVFGIITDDQGREAVHGSLRTSQSTLAVGRFLRDALGTDPMGRPHGGGRAGAGGFEIDVGFLRGGDGDDDGRAMKWALYDRRIRRRLFEAAGVAERGGES